MRLDLRSVQSVGLGVWVLALLLLYAFFALRNSSAETEDSLRRQEELYALTHRLEETMASVIALVEESTNLTIAANEHMLRRNAEVRRRQQMAYQTGERQPHFSTPGTWVKSGNSEYFRYLRTPGNCTITDISLKYDEQCITNLPSNYIRQVLVVAVQRSGTHFIWEMLNRLGCKVHHEGVGPDGAVSWLYAYRATRYTINNPERLSRHRFRYVFHQVRHPLRVISTLMALQKDWNRFWAWTYSVEKSVHQRLSPLKRAMQLWVAWNKHIEKYADLRFRSEDTSPRDVCRWAGFDESKCSSHDPEKPIVDPTEARVASQAAENGNEKAATRRLSSGESADSGGSSSGDGDGTGHPPRVEITWADLDAEDPVLAATIKAMCLEYGYDLDPSVLPQLASTKEFKA